MLRRELSWLAGGVAGSIAVGVLFDRASLSVPLYLAAHAVWLLWRMDRLARWLEGKARAADAPPTLGLTDRIVELVHREKKYSRKQKHRYRNALAQFHSLAAELPDATVVLGPEREIRWSNTAAQPLLGVRPERDRGQRIDNLVRSPEFRDFLASSDAGSELELELPGGSGRTLAVRNVPSGNRMSVLIARDVTQRVRVREMRKAFVGDVSHELRTPLTVIEGYVELLRDTGATFDADTRRALDHIAAQSARMRQIVEHLLQLSRLEGNPLEEHEGESVAVGPLLRSMVATLGSTMADDVAGRFELDIDDALALSGSESEIWSACNNLLVNAVRYGGERGRIRVGWRQDEEGRPVYSVADEGPGIEARHLPRLSERFYRVDQARSRDSGGTGLGLAIVKHVAQRHGGQLHVQSTPGRGSTFRIEFPLSRAVCLRAAASA